MIEVLRYTPDHKGDWDNFVTKAKNGTFLFYRDYMEYHADRFEDFSSMLYENGKLKSVFPCNRVNDVAYSHQGLTFGGILIEYKTSSLKYIEYFNTYNAFFQKSGINKVIYKTTPPIYKTYFGDEEDYIMFRVDAKRISSNLSSCINLTKDIHFTQGRKYSLKKSIKNKIHTRDSDDWRLYWHITNENLQTKHNAKPVHNIEEILSLKNNFPDNIKLFGAYKENELIAGVVVFKYQNVIKIQYSNANVKGKEFCAIDNIYNFIISEYKSTYNYMDIGPSNLNNGTYINQGLLNQKEGFGARGVTYNVYEYYTSSIIDL